MLRNPLATSPMLRSARHSSELWVLRPANTGIMAAQHNSNSAIRSRNPTNAHVSRNGGKSRSLRTLCGPIKVLALWLDGPPYRRSREHYGYMPRCVRQPLPRLRFVGWTARSVETVYPRRHVLYCLWNRLRPRPWSLLWSGRWSCDRHHDVDAYHAECFRGSGPDRALFIRRIIATYHRRSSAQLVSSTVVKAPRQIAPPLSRVMCSAVRQASQGLSTRRVSRELSPAEVNEISRARGLAICWQPGNVYRMGRTADGKSCLV